MPEWFQRILPYIKVDLLYYLVIIALMGIAGIIVSLI